jgi:hypothetical protein
MKLPRGSVLSLALLYPVLVLGLSSCNIYKPLASPSNDEEYIQEAQKCLNDGNYTCALDAYSKIGATDLKNEKLCLAQLTRAGLGISELVQTISSDSSGSGMLGALARALIPWTEEKETAALAAITECDKLSTISETQKSSLLRILAYLSDCSIRLAKTDVKVATSESTTSCNSTTDGDNDGVLASTDIATTPGAALSTSNPGMCEFDVRKCIANIDTANALASGLGGDLSGVSGNLTDVPAALKDSNTATTTARQALITTL